MAHIVKQIADAIVTVLDGATEAGSDVTHRRFTPSPSGTAADVIVYSDIEDIAVAAMGGTGGLLERTISFKIQGRLTGSEDTLEARSYAFESAVEQAIMADRTLGGIVTDITPVMGQTFAENTGEKPHLIRILTYTALAHTLAGSPETPH